MTQSIRLNAKRNKSFLIFFVLKKLLEVIPKFVDFGQDFLFFGIFKDFKYMPLHILVAFKNNLRLFELQKGLRIYDSVLRLTHINI